MLSDQGKKTPALIQEVVKVNLIQDSASMPAPLKVEQNTCIVPMPTVEILIGNTTIRFFNNTDKDLIETTLKCMGGVMLC